MTEHVHTPELRLKRDYAPGFLRADVWVCAECEAFLGWADETGLGCVG